MAMMRALWRYDYDLVLAEMGPEPSDSERVLSWFGCGAAVSAPIIVLSSIRSPARIAVTLNAGADDFIHLPFEPVEFSARVQAVLRRCDRRIMRQSIELVGFALDKDSERFLDRGKPIELTRREFAMAWLFFSMPGTYISREKISNVIWGTSSEVASRTIEQHVYKLRKKLQLGAERGVIIRTAYTQGYRLELLRHDVPV
jgi:DNA-binding response OmpR family regulator